MVKLHTRSWWMAVALGLGPTALPHCGPTAPPPATASATASATAAPLASAEAKAAMTPADVDRMLGELWAKEGLKPAPIVDDARFLRRLSIDLRGVIPSPQEVTEFLADTAPDKRRKAIAKMLEGPRFAEHWTNYWDRVLMGRKVREQQVDRAEFRGWLRAKFDAKTPWDKVVYELITAEGQNRAGDGAGAGDEKVNGAVNWLLKYRDTPADLSGATSRVFLGVQIQCAQCHDHKTEKWKTDDFRSLTACFMQTRGDLVERDGKKRVVNVRDVDRPVRGPAKRREMMAEYIEAKPAALDGTDFSSGPSRRKALASWMTSPSNPWFARAIVNRMWGHLFGRGIVDPVDDFRDSNPPVAPELLGRLAEDFSSRGHDLRALLALLTSTEAYQRAAAPRSENPAEGRLWARYRMMPMGSDELFDSLIAATRLDELLARNKEDSIDQIRQQARNQFASFFDVDEEDDDDDFDGTIPQALLLMNGRAMSMGSSSVPGAALDEILEAPGDDASKIRALYLRTLSREPTADETTRWVAFVNEPREAVRAEPAPEPAAGKGKKGKKGQAGPDPLAKLDKPKKLGPRAARKQAFEDVFWTLLNSSEFYFNH